MKKHAGQMMPVRISTKQLAVCHVAYPCEGMPVAVKVGGECPDNAFGGPSLPNLPVFSHIIIIIKVDKLMISYLPVNCKCCYD